MALYIFLLIVSLSIVFTFTKQIQLLSLVKSVAQFFMSYECQIRQTLFYYFVSHKFKLSLPDSA